MNITNMQRMILQVVKEYPGIQDETWAVIAAIWRKSDWRDDRTMEENLRCMPRPESITRRLRELHQMGLITYSQKADETREEAFKNERELHGGFIGRIFGGRD